MKSFVPISDGIKKYVKEKKTRFHMPGHKGQGKGIKGYLKKIYPYDVTELPETDNLYNACGIINASENMVSKIFGSKYSLYSCSGATLCVQTALAVVRQYSERIACDRNCHISVINAMALLRFKPCWIYRDYNNDFGIPLAADEKHIEDILINNPDIKAVFITSPDYYGTVSDIKKISLICKHYGASLIVDNSHGSYFAFTEDRELHPCFSGADLVIDSFHKTLPVLTGGAALHICNDLFKKEEAKEKMILFGSSSPSYIIMAGIEAGLCWGNENAKKELKRLKNKISFLKNDIRALGFSVLENDDYLKIVINTFSKHISGYDAYNFLYVNNIVCEMADYRNIVLMISPFNKNKDFKRLLKTLCKTPQSLEIIDRVTVVYGKTETVLSLEEALFAKTEEVEIDLAEGKICGETVVLYPPSVPIIVKGELITKDIAECIKAVLKDKQRLKIII